MKKELGILILCSLGLKVLYLCFALIFKPTGETIPAQYVNMCKKNDAHWYQGLAENGYPKIENKRDLGFAEGENFKQSEWAFFPFYPMLNRLSMKATKLPYNGTAFFWSILFSILSMIGMYLFAKHFFKDKEKALFVSLLLFCFPFGFYFSMFYTEAVFFTFMIFSFLSIAYKKPIALAFCLIPLILTRPNGVIILLPLYLYYLETEGYLSKYQLNWRKVFNTKNILQSLFFITGPLALAAYCYYQYKMTGYYMAFSHAQQGWYKEFMFPLFALFRKGDVASQYYSVFVIVVLLYSLSIFRKLPLSLNVLIWINILLPLTSGAVISMGRFCSILFPLFLILGNQISQFRLKNLILFGILILQLLSFSFWLNNHPIAY